MPTQFERIYCGSQWLSISREATKLVCDYTKRHPSFYNRMKMTFAPEESYIQTVIMNLCPNDKIIYKNYRYIRWHNENGNSPANLGSLHFHLLAETDNFFARKMDKTCSKELIKLIDKYLLEEQKPLICDDGTWKYEGLTQYKYDYRLT